jgi:membrane-bound serine protease (ClpP class)
MVDPDVDVFAIFEGEDVRLVSEAEEIEKIKGDIRTKTVSAEGKLLTLTAGEAHEIGLASLLPATLDDLVGSLGFEPDAKMIAKISWSEYIVRFLTHPVVSGLLLTFGVLGIFFELQMPGWGVSGSLGVVCLVMFFGGHYIAGLASIADIMLFAIGLALLAAEAFIVPGFGVTGVSGMLCILAGIYLALVKRPIPQFSWDYQMLNSAILVFISFTIAAAVGIVLIWKLSPDSRLRKIMVLSASEQAEEGYTASESLASLEGRKGESITHLRPAGRASIDGEPREVQSEGEFIEKDRAVKVIRVVGNKVFVAEAKEDAQEKEA